MLTNHLYNLITQLSNESQSSWRIDSYLKDAAGCPECGAFWQEMKRLKEKHIQDLSALVQKHMKTNPKEESPRRAKAPDGKTFKMVENGSARRAVSV